MALEEFKSFITASYNSGVFDPVFCTHWTLGKTRGWVGMVGRVHSLNDPAFYSCHLWLLLILADAFFLTLLFRPLMHVPIRSPRPCLSSWLCRFPVTRSCGSSDTLRTCQQRSRRPRTTLTSRYRKREPWTAAAERLCLCTVVQTPSAAESMTRNPEETLLSSLAIHSCILNPKPPQKQLIAAMVSI